MRVSANALQTCTLPLAFTSRLFSQCKGDVTETTIGASPILRINLTTLLQQTIVVQTPQGPVEVPATLIMGAVKTLFDQLYNIDRQGPVTLPQG